MLVYYETANHHTCDFATYMFQNNGAPVIMYIFTIPLGVDATFALTLVLRLCSLLILYTARAL